jgi:hypothetical protein
MTQQIANGRLPLDNTPDQRGIGFELCCCQIIGINGDILNADGGVIETDDMSAEDVFAS